MSSIIQQTSQARALFDELQNILSARDLMVWEEGRIWHELKKDSRYKYVFGDSGESNNEQSWAAFVREAGVPKSTVEMRIRLHEFWVLKCKIPVKLLQTIHTRKLDRVRSFIEEGRQTVVDVLEQAQILPYSDFIIWLNGNEEPCHHPKRNRKRATKDIEVCGDCSKELTHKH